MNTLIKELAEHLGLDRQDYPEADRYHEDNYVGAYETIEEFVRESLIQWEEFPEVLEGHVNLTGVWECELRHDYFYIESDNELHFYINV